MRCQWKYHLDPNRATLHVDRRLPDLTAGGSLVSARYVPDEYRTLLDAILAVPGVESVRMDNHAVGITKGMLFDWDEIADDVAGLVVKQFDPGRVTEWVE